MTAMAKYLTTLATALFLAGALAACDEDGPAEEAGEAIDDAAEEAGEAAEDAADEVEDSTD